MRRLLIPLVLVAALIGLAPWILYGIGLSNIMGRPVPRTVTSPGAHRVNVPPLSPWSYVMAFASADPRAFDDSTKAAWLVARSYNVSHLKRRQTLWWHLSGAALTIWLIRNWTSEQILDSAAAGAEK